MEKNYLDYHGLGKVIGQIKKKEPVVFKGTEEEWNALTPAEQSSYEMRVFSGDYTTVVYTDAVTELVEADNHGAVSSNAVYLYLKKIKSHPDDLEYKDNDPDYEPPANAQTGVDPATSSGSPVTSETFDTITETWADGSQDVFGVGVLNKGADDETITRLIYPDGSEMTFTGW